MAKEDRQQSADEAADAQAGRGALPRESLEQGSAASTYVDNPDAPDSAIAQLEKLPGEK